MMKDIQCDIIIPVYNAPDELKECVDSLVKFTEKKHRIIIINDCSPDRNVDVYLETIKDIENISILKNDTNLGFVGTVNRGMSYSNRDVILLNSDTVLTKNWLDKLISVAYSDSSIATVTPLTNNGTICSVPNFNEDNEIPDGFTVDSFAYFVEKISLKLFPQIPTAVGFCMFIKRNVIEEVGLFDAETFGKGYGEENDFCCRVIEHGYRNVLADNTFVYHKGSMSFKDEKADLINKNLKVLNQRYPYYEKSIHDFIFIKNPLKRIHENINLRIPHYRNFSKKQGNILIIVHNFFDEIYNHPVGGTEFHVRDIVTQINEYDFYIMVSNGSEIVLKHFSEGILVEKYRFKLENPLAVQSFHHKEYATLLEKIITFFDIGLVHIHHLITHSFDAPNVAKKLGVKVIFTLHDYYLFCPRINLLDEKNKYCIDIRSDEKCTSCISTSHSFHTNFIEKWKQQVNLMLHDNVDLYITPSNNTKEMFEREFNLKNIIIVEHGVEYPQNNSCKSSPQTGKLKVGFIGGLSPNKGSEMIYELITKYPKDKIEWHLIGGIGDQKLNLLEQSNLVKHGHYKREDLDSILLNNNIDITALISPWPETFSYTLSESWRNNLPVLVTPMGALKERVENINGGWVAEESNIHSIINKLNYILTLNSDEFNKIRENIKNYSHKKLTDMTQEYKMLYSKYTCNSLSATNQTFDNNELLESLKYYLPNDNNNYEQYNNQIIELKNELHLIKTTIGWKILTRLRERHGWSLKYGKKLVYLALRYKRIRG